MTTPDSPPVPRRPLARPLLAATGILSLVVSLLAAVGGWQAATADDTLVLDHQHTDAVSVRYEDSALVLKTRADLDTGAGQILDPDAVVFHVTDAQKDVVPGIPAFSFLGEPGTDVWKISQTYIPGQLWAGWETESLPRGVFAGDGVRLELTELTGPGTVELYLNDVEGPRRLLSSTDPALRTIVEHVGAHTHANWIFSAPGDYALTFVAHAELVSGTPISSAPQRYRFRVGSEGADPEPGATPDQGATPDPTASPDPGSTPEPTVSPDPAPEPTPSPAPSTPTPVDPTVAPASPLAEPDPGTLTEQARGGVTLSADTVRGGASVTVAVPGPRAAHWVSVWMLSAPADLGWKQVNAEGTVVVAVPDDAELGAHRLVVRDTEGALVGWAPLTVAPDEAVVEQCIATPVTSTVRPDDVDVVASGHFDFGPVLEGDALLARVKDDRSAPPPWVDPGTLVFHLTDAAAAEAPGGQFAFLGSGRVWQIPLTQQSGVPWLGWNTQHPSIAGNTRGEVALTLDALDGPGRLAVYSVNSWGQLGERYFGTVDGFPRSTSVEVGAAGVHVHGIWAFTEPGAYHATMTYSGDIGGGQRSATTTLTFFVGEGDPRSAVREQTVTTYLGRTADGEECRLALAETGIASGEAVDLVGLSGTLLVVGAALLGAAALHPRRPRPPRSRLQTP